MSATTTNTGGILKTNFDYSKLFIYGNQWKNYSYTNGTGSTVNLTKGQIMGLIFSSSKVTPQVSTAIDGSQKPFGILANNYTVANGATVTVSVCVYGQVAVEGLTFGGSDTITTRISLDDNAGTPNKTYIGTIESLLIGIGINPITTTENTGFDN